MIYTSYFDNINNIVASIPDARFVSIAGKTPDGFVGEKYQKLMPLHSWWCEWHGKFIDTIESNESKAWYIKKYTETVLSKLDLITVAQEVKDMCNWHSTFILCYETPEKFCHRHIVADWFKSSRIECEEWKR